MKNRKMSMIFGLAALVLTSMIAGAELNAVHAKEQQAVYESFEKYVYMGGLYASDPFAELSMTMFRTQDGELVAEVEHNGEYVTGDFVTESAVTSDGYEYTKMSIGNMEIGYHFRLDNDDMESFLVDEDGTVYIANEIPEDVAMELISVAR